MFLISIHSVVKMIDNYRTFVRGKYFDRTVSCDGFVYLITGSSAGIGVETAREIARMGGTVILACRSREKAQVVANDIIQTTKCAQSKVIILALDLSDLSSVRNCVKVDPSSFSLSLPLLISPLQSFHQLGLSLHCLINNAGVMLPEREVNKDGYEMMLTSNHLGHFLLTSLLLPDIEKTGSEHLPPFSLYLSLFLCVSHCSKEAALSMSPLLSTALSLLKLASTSLTSCPNTPTPSSEPTHRLNWPMSSILLSSTEGHLLSRSHSDHVGRLRLTNSPVIVVAVHPGAVLTEVTRSLPFLIRIAHTVFTPLMLLLQVSFSLSLLPPPLTVIRNSRLKGPIARSMLRPLLGYLSKIVGSISFIVKKRFTTLSLMIPPLERSSGRSVRSFVVLPLSRFHLLSQSVSQRLSELWETNSSYSSSISLPHALKEHSECLFKIRIASLRSPAGSGFESKVLLFAARQCALLYLRRSSGEDQPLPWKWISVANPTASSKFRT
jgi:NAD(P)-dependent dehydrogenase (short-subunit alcohol dehydrogenase family)